MLHRTILAVVVLSLFIAIVWSSIAPASLSEIHAPIEPRPTCFCCRAFLCHHQFCPCSKFNAL
uniref:Transmembrane protein n=1 Tax=Heterorhabditis bacteriophora TaxID=37862 RepID=A0A1I7WZW8_HETBA